MNFEEMKRLALDIYRGNVTTFTKKDGKEISADDALRELIEEKCNGKWNYNNYQKIKWDLFEILEEIVTVSSTDPLKEKFEAIMVWKDTALGDRIDFRVENGDLFEVSVVADGNGNFLRQRIQNDRVSTTAFNLGVAIYEEWTAFYTKSIKFDEMINRVVKSFDNKIVKLIGETFAKAYDSIDSHYKVTGKMESTKLLELSEKVGGNTVIYGTRLALAKLPFSANSQTDLNDIRNNGHVMMSNGLKCVILENTYDKNTDKFALPNDTLFIIPEGEKVMYGGFEGEAWVHDDKSGDRKDRQVEFFYERRLHLGVAVSNRFGTYKITG